MSYNITGIDVHKRMVAVVVADVADGERDYQFQRRKFGTSPGELKLLAEWLVEQDVREVAMESTAQYWKPVWRALEQYWQQVCGQREQDGNNKRKLLHLAQAKSNPAPRGRKRDFADAERLVKRLVAQELVLSYVPGPEQQQWRALTRNKYQLTRDRVRLQNQLEGLLEQAHIKLSSFVSDLLGLSARRILSAIAGGETNVEKLAELADHRLRASKATLCDALSACEQLASPFRKMIKMDLQRLELIEIQIEELEKEIAEVLNQHQDAIQRLSEVPGLGVDSAQQIIAEIGATAATFPSEKHLASWVGVCPGEKESAEQSQSHRSPKGNCTLRRLFNQAAQCAVKVKGSIFYVKFQQLIRGLKFQEAIWAIAHRICRLVWKILHQGTRYQERGPSVSVKSEQARTKKMIKDLARRGYTVIPPALQPAS